MHWDEINDAFYSSNIFNGLHMDISNINKPNMLIEELDGQIEGIKGFHEFVRESFDSLEVDLYRFVEKFGVSKNDIDKNVPYYDNPFWNRGGDWVFLFSNRLMELTKISLALKLNHLYYKSMKEPWSKELLHEILEIKSELKKYVVEKEYCD